MTPARASDLEEVCTTSKRKKSCAAVACRQQDTKDKYRRSAPVSPNLLAATLPKYNP